ncbi:hypothetical protein LINPERPRIM_LOCUS29228 [Linum perenne]
MQFLRQSEQRWCIPFEATHIWLWKCSENMRQSSP